jgi:hypothetical protein
MMKNIRAGRLLPVLTLLLCLFWLGPMTIAQQPATPDPGAMTQPQQSQEQNAQIFTGKIVKSGSKFMLRDSSNKTYQLDDQEKAKQFQGKSVKVTGTLDESTETIQVTAIEPAA